MSAALTMCCFHSKEPNWRVPLVSCADNVLLPLSYAPFQQHIGFSLLFFSFSSWSHIIDKCTFFKIFIPLRFFIPGTGKHDREI